MNHHITTTLHLMALSTISSSSIILFLDRYTRVVYQCGDWRHYVSELYRR